MSIRIPQHYDRAARLVDAERRLRQERAGREFMLAVGEEYEVIVFELEYAETDDGMFVVTDGNVAMYGCVDDISGEETERLSGE